MLGRNEEGKRNGQENPVVARHEPPPRLCVPPDVFTPKTFQAEARIEDEPQEVLENPEQHQEADDAKFVVQWRRDAESVPEMGEAANEEVKAYMLPCDGRRTEHPACPPVLETPRREV